MTKHQKTEPKAPSLTAAIAATKPEPSALDARSIDELLAEPDTEPTPETPTPEPEVHGAADLTEFLFVGGPQNGQREKHTRDTKTLHVSSGTMLRTGSYEMDAESGLATWNPITPDDFDRLPPVDNGAPVA